jgi:hypothetical protein
VTYFIPPKVKNEKIIAIAAIITAIDIPIVSKDGLMLSTAITASTENSKDKKDRIKVYNTLKQRRIYHPISYT